MSHAPQSIRGRPGARSRDGSDRRTRSAGRRTRTRIGVALFAVAILTLAAPLASAVHWSVHQTGMTPSTGITHEPDSQVVRRGGHILDGRANAVTEPGAVPGDGGRFLDARLGNGHRTANTGQVGPHIFPGAFAADVTGRSDLLLPGQLAASAWYGEWLDLDGDGVIDDRCQGCPEDEFVWRGRASGATLNMVQFLVPSPLNAGRAGAQSRTDGILEDHTNDAADPGWYGPAAFAGDSPVLTRIYAVVAADVQLEVGTELEYDLDTPGALIDVDAYEAVSPDVEALYLGANAMVRAVQDGGTTPIVAAINEAVGEARKPVDDARDEAEVVVDEATAAVSEPQATANDARDTAEDLVEPRHAKEPNHSLDDFNGHAQYGGVGDALGSYNTYVGYEDSHHLYADVTSHHAAFKSLAEIAYRFEPDLVGGVLHGNRSAGQYLYFEGHVFLWKDVNRDTHLNSVCNPQDPEDFDAERNTCTNAPAPWPHSVGQSSTAEVVQACEASNSRGSTFTVRPLGGNWPNVVVLRDFDPRTGVLAVETYSGNEAIDLRWADACSFGRYLRSRDAILFPTQVSTVAVLVESPFSIDGFSHPGLGIRLGAEAVTDVDLLVQSL